jgi:hypothetical protein
VLALKKRWKAATLLAVGLGICATLVALVAHPWEERIGQENSDCMQYDRVSIPNGKGLVVTAYTTGCSPPAASVVSYVFVHDERGRPRSENLVFRYTQSAGGSEPIELKWMDENHISIKVQSVSDISVMAERAGAISILYEIQKATS